MVGRRFPIIFIDPTGWTGYPFTKIGSLLRSRKCEVIINYMYDHINRFVASPDKPTEESLDQILGGSGWKSRLDKSLPLGAAAEKLFRETLKKEGQFAYVVSTRVEKGTIDRPHFFLAYGTKDRKGLITFRDIEFEALKKHARSRSEAKELMRQRRTGHADMFATEAADWEEETIEQLVDSEKKAAAELLLRTLQIEGPLPFAKTVERLLEPHMLRETNVKDICVTLAQNGKIECTWGSGRNKPKDDSLIRLAT